jgi:phospholipid-binding lipoprotein MlaA
MLEGKVKTLLLAMVLGILSLNNLCFAIVEQKTNKYPNYSSVYNGEDKFEGFNRKMFNFNIKANKYVLKPINILWASIMPKYAMERVKGCCTNIEYPKRMVSSLLQKDFKATGTETARFLINSTIGLGGMFDPAKNKFHIEPAQEDMEQVLSKYHAKKGPYLVLPFTAPQNVRGYVGRIFDAGLNPSTYFLGVGPIIAKAGVMTNKTSYSQELIKNLEETYVDPYDVAKKLYGIDNYIKNTNLDRKEVLAKIVDAQKMDWVDKADLSTEMKPDIVLDDYDPQCPVVDSMRTSFFCVPKTKKSIWSDLSVWNRSFDKKIKTAEVNIDPKRVNYKYRYILQKDKTAPIAIVYPSIGEGSFSHHPVVFAKIFHDAGYSVIIQGSPFHWQFVKSAPKDYRPGLPAQDAKYTRLVTAKILKNLEAKEKINPSGKIVVGTSYGGLTTLFVAAQEEKENTLNVSKYISISPPVDMLYALKKMDSYSEKCNQNGPELQEKTAVAAGKLMQIYRALADDSLGENPPPLSLTEEEGIIATNFMMRQKLSDLIFTLEEASKTKRTDIYKQICSMSFSDYFKKYLPRDNKKSINEMNYEMSLYSIEKFLANSGKYKIYEAKDDYFINETQLCWLKKIGANKVVLLQNGSHLGFLYRKEFQESFKKDIFMFKPDSNLIHIVER